MYGSSRFDECVDGFDESVAPRAALLDARRLGIALTIAAACCAIVLLASHALAGSSSPQVRRAAARASSNAQSPRPVATMSQQQLDVQAHPITLQTAPKVKRATTRRHAAAAPPAREDRLNPLAAMAPSHGTSSGASAPVGSAKLGLSASWLATTYIGTPYVWAGGTPADGFDCSGLAVFVYGVLGVQLPRTTWSMWAMPQGKHITESELRPGDLVFFNALEHMGIYVGHGDYVQAPHTGDRVKISHLADAHDYYGAVRLIA